MNLTEHTKIQLVNHKEKSITIGKLNSLT